MAALTKGRKTRKMGEATIADRLYLPLKAGNRVFAGGMVALLKGYLVAGSVMTGLVAVGIAEHDADNTTSTVDGFAWVHVRQGTFAYFNFAANPVTQADVGNDCFIIDDQTVAQSDGGGARSRAGKILGVFGSGDESQVWVQQLLI